ncbi:hypothetical protein FRX94_07125 [Corynebacterium canis]|uniref:Uncharacterized protein n=1 Tax=Corynebacterium canis TaxID=679663 RepID=A0A5C5UGN4_9CORY|nr:hypothetical protein [Corynebacterium canis]TWT25029.1 hypothetical protein FRX94_07125 [Corynebacterium canis]WJY76090.1 hypothetical protein CCANI_11360 [Corynebacterium canis]
MTRPGGPGDDEPTEWIGQQSGHVGARGLGAQSFGAQAGARGNREIGWPTAAAGDSLSGGDPHGASEASGASHIDPPTEHFAPQSHAPQSHGQPQAVQPQASLHGGVHGGVDKQFGGGYFAHGEDAHSDYAPAGEYEPAEAADAQAGDEYGQSFGPDTGEHVAYQRPSRQNTGLWILVMSLVLVLGLLLGVSAYFLYAGFPNQRSNDQPAETSAGAPDSNAGDSIGEDLPITSDAERPPEEPVDDSDGYGSRPTDVDLPADATPANLFARTGYKNGMLFNLYVAGGATDEFALSVQTEYRTKWPGFDPPRGEHYLSVDVAGQGEVDLACNDNGSYVLCATASGKKVYIV